MHTGEIAFLPGFSDPGRFLDLWLWIEDGKEASSLVATLSEWSSLAEALGWEASRDSVQESGKQVVIALSVRGVYIGSVGPRHSSVPL